MLKNIFRLMILPKNKVIYQYNYIYQYRSCRHKDHIEMFLRWLFIFVCQHMSKISFKYVASDIYYIIFCVMHSTLSTYDTENIFLFYFLHCRLFFLLYIISTFCFSLRTEYSKLFTLPITQCIVVISFIN